MQTWLPPAEDCCVLRYILIGTGNRLTKHLRGLPAYKLLCIKNSGRFVGMSTNYYRSVDMEYCFSSYKVYCCQMPCPSQSLSLSFPVLSLSLSLLYVSVLVSLSVSLFVSVSLSVSVSVSFSLSLSRPGQTGKKALAMWASGFKFLLAHKKIHSPTSFERNQDNFKVQNLILIERQLMWLARFSCFYSNSLA